MLNNISPYCQCCQMLSHSHTNCAFWRDVAITMNLQLYSSMIFIDNKVDG